MIQNRSLVAFFTELRGRIITSLDIGFIFRTGGLQRGDYYWLEEEKLACPHEI
jgi:hypothetical protein